MGEPGLEGDQGGFFRLLLQAGLEVSLLPDQTGLHVGILTSVWMVLSPQLLFGARNISQEPPANTTLSSFRSFACREV